MGSKRLEADRAGPGTPRASAHATLRHEPPPPGRGGTNALRARSRSGFTLIEILVVVAIIALLISILLPSLKRARDQARSAVCAANVGNICRAEGTYQVSNQEWIPGSPLTTGSYWAISGTNVWNPFIPGFNRFVVEWFDFSTPLRAHMQGGGSIPRAPSASQSDSTRYALYRLMTEDVFHCPSNPQVASPYGGAGPDGIRATSYLTMNTIIRGGPDVYNKTGKFARYQALNLPNGNSTLGQSPGWDVRVPDFYLPRHSKLGRESMKVFIADGLRFYGGPTANPPFTYNTNRAERDGKGIMSATPPSTATVANNREYILAKQYSWRHGDGNRINAGFFDGHVEGLLADTNSDPMKGNAIHPKYYYPSGSIVAIPSGMQIPIPVGTELP